MKAAWIIFACLLACARGGEPDKLAASERVGDAWSDPRNPIVRIFGGERLGLWSLKPVRRPDPPAVKDAKWPRTPVDYFVLNRLEEAGLRPMPEAGRRALARRLYFDLTGLPPTPEQMQAFLADSRPDAYERLVEALLASPEYGEHWARYWLDVVRYSDSNGFDWDEFRPLAWRFRDYVVRSFNADKPFDEFVREQLAGDELVDGAPKTIQDQDRLIATGYLRLGPHDNSAPLFNEQARSRAELMADLTETTASAFLGLTFSCNRCHDHKFDPFSQEDHYRLRAFFEPVEFADDLPLDLAEEQERIREHNAGIDEAVAPLERELKELMEKVRSQLRAERVAGLAPEEQALLTLPENEHTEADKAKIEEIEEKVRPDDNEVREAFNEEQKARHESLSNEIKELRAQKREFSTGLLMVDGEDHNPPTYVLQQGNHKQPGQEVEPGFISVLDPNPARIPKPPNPKSSGRRLALANWIVSPENPLTARVLVNRLWQRHFGEGICATASDFGLAGARPTHPKLLDWLASELVRREWSIKAMHRLIVTSATYRQASSGGAGRAEALHFVSLRRLTAEQLRDSLLAVSGLLRPYPGGPPLWPELPVEVLQSNPAFLDDNAEKTKGWYPSPEGAANVRSLYLVQKRTVRIPFLETFDLPDNSTSCARRTESIVAPQALLLLNSPLAESASRAFAERVRAEAGPGAEGRITRAFALAFQRVPADEELRACEELLRRRSLAELCRVLLNANEFLYVD